MNRKRIAFVSDAVYPYNKGGKETRLHEITTRLAQRGYDIHIYCMKWWSSPEAVRRENGVTLHAISPNYPLYSGERRSIRQGILFGLACLKLITEPFDIVEVDHMPYFPLFSTKFVCVLKRKKMYATWHEVWGEDYWLQYLGKLGFIAGWIETIAMKLPDKFISVSEHTSKQLRTFVDKEKIITIPNGIDLESIRKAKPSKITSEVMFAGRLLKHKNVDRLIKAIALLVKKTPDIHCLILGNGPEEHKLKKLVISLGITQNISFRNFLETKEQLFGLMKSSKIFVLPSLREGFGLTVLEAYACGLPFITSASPANAAREFTHLHGIIGSVQPNQLAQHIRTLLATEQSPPKNNTELQRYSWDTIVSEIIEKIIEPPHALLQTPVRFYPAIGGVENHVYYLSKELVKQGNTVTVVCADVPKSNLHVVDGIIIRRLPSSFKITNTDITPLLPIILLRESFDIIHTHMPTPWTADISVIIAKIKRKASVITIHNDMDKPDRIGRLLTWLYLHTFFRITLSLVDKIIIVNPAWRKSFTMTRKLLHDYEGKIEEIPNGVDTELFTPGKPHNASICHLLFVSILDEYHEFKGLSYLIDAIHSLSRERKSFILTIVGDGKLREKYEAEVEQRDLGNYIRFVGAKSQTELVSYYKNSNVFILPSVNIEGFGIVLLEAMACGLPIITTDITGVADVIKKQKCGLVIKPRDTEGLRGAIEKLLTDDAMREEYSINSLNTSRNMYSWKIITRNIVDVYRELI